MAHHEQHGHAGHGHAPPNTAAGVNAHGHADVQHGHVEFPTWKTYRWVALILTLITVVEVWVYYIPSFVASRLFVPSLLIMSAVKFVIVVLFYMHLKYDARLFRALFTGPLLLAGLTVIALLFLFGQLVIRQ